MAHKSGFIPLIALAFFLGANLSIALPKPKPTTDCLMQHTPKGRDAAGVTVMEHRKKCDD